MNRYFLAAAITAATGGAAMSADATAPAFDWSGVYAGLNGGYAFGGSDKVGVATPASVTNFGDLSLHGAFGGAQAGVNFQTGAIVFGIEGDIEAGDISDTDHVAGNLTVDSKSQADVFGTARGRLGFAAGPALLYVTGGLAVADVNYQVSLSPGPSIQGDNWRAGYVLGGGAEYAFDPAWSLKLEYQYLNFGKHTLAAGRYRTFETADFHTVRLGLNYRF